jgi:hypothetical protein
MINLNDDFIVLLQRKIIWGYNTSSGHDENSHPENYIP